MIGNVGFIGLGNMGKPMALNLSKPPPGFTAAGTKHGAPNRRRRTGLRLPEEVARATDLTFIMVSDTPDVEQVPITEGVVSGPVGFIVVDMSTISPVATRSLAAQLTARG
jgi:3-hydroxyisobutyrate dehydrogenase-like beta-hydroxyacid dehydrogenase